MPDTKRLRDANDVATLTINTSQLAGGSLGDFLIRGVSNWIPTSFAVWIASLAYYRLEIDPTLDRIPFRRNATGEMGQTSAFAITKSVKISPVPIASDDVIDLTDINETDDGNIIIISGTDDIDTLTIPEGKTYIFEIQDEGGSFTDAGNIVVAGGTLYRRAGMRVRATGRSGGITALEPLTHLQGLGDLDGTGNGNRIIVDDTLGRIIIEALLVSVGKFLGKVIIGDLPAGLGNNTRITVDDAGGVQTIELEAANGATLNGDAIVTATRPVVAKTEADSPVTATAAQSGTVFTNGGAGNNVTVELPASAGCVAGKTRLTFGTLDTGNNSAFAIQVNGSDHLYVLVGGANFDITGGAIITSDPQAGELMTVLYIGGGVWIAESVVGTWT